MFQFQSRSTRNFSTFLKYIRDLTSTLILIVLTALFYLNRVFSLASYIFAAAVFIAFNIIFLLRQIIEYYVVLALYILAVFANALLYYANVSINLLNYVVDSILVLTALFTYIYYYRYYSNIVDVVLQPHIPFIVLISTIMGISFGVEYPLRLIVLTTIDTLSSLIVASATSIKNVVHRYTSSILIFILLYTSPIVNIKLGALLVFALLHLIRNVLLFSGNNKYQRLINIVLSMDLLVKPIVAISV